MMDEDKKEDVQEVMEDDDQEEVIFIHPCPCMCQTTYRRLVGLGEGS